MLLLFLLLPISVLGHGNMVWPPVWWDARGEIGLTEYANCAAGYQYSFYGDPAKSGANCFWYSNYTYIVGEPTLDPALWTFPNIEEGMEKYIERHPWRAPGSAPIYSPCGAAGGNPLGCPEGAPMGPGQDCGQPFGGAFSYGPKAEDMEFEDMVTTEWMAGESAVVGWGMAANHGGGYSYRLCRLPEGGRAELTEECFQQTPLRFASDMSWVQWGEDISTKVSFLANRTTEGTLPPGSQWSKNPIPNCAGLGGGYLDDDSSCPEGLQFPAPAPGLFGQGNNIHNPDFFPDFAWSLMDEVEVPADLSPGEYVLSFRWDCEQTAQVWNACSNIRILAVTPKAG